MMKSKLVWLVVFASAGLAACGGSADDNSIPAPVTANEVPDSALVSATAYQQFASTLVNSETAAPLNLDKVVKAPISETLAPAKL